MILVRKYKAPKIKLRKWWATAILLMVFSFSGCEKAFEIYVGFPLQPENINSVYVPGFNVFGMCKTGKTLDEYNQHFEVHVIPHIFDTISDVSYGGARINLRKGILDYTLFHQGDGIYLNQNIIFNPGDVWSYTCIADTFKITSETTIPNMPVVEPVSVSLASNNLSFSISTDETAFLYDVTYVDQFGYATKRIIPEHNGFTHVDLEIDYNETSLINYLYVVAYDENYERYISTSNIFFKPNAYRPRFTTVDGGYGCFCSLTSLNIDLKKILTN